MNQGFLFIQKVQEFGWSLKRAIWSFLFGWEPFGVNQGGDSELPKPNDVSGNERSSVQYPPTCKVIKTQNTLKKVQEGWKRLSYAIAQGVVVH